MAATSDSHPDLDEAEDASLAASFGSHVNIVATSPDSRVDRNPFQVRYKGVDDETVTAWCRHEAMFDLYGIEEAMEYMLDIINVDNLVLGDFDTSEVALPLYSNQQKILLVGEGDFSFSSCLADAFFYASNITATSLDSRETVVREYCKGEGHLRNLTSRGAVVIHQVDAGTMDAHPQLRGNLFDRIIFNFPHAGGTYYGVKESDAWYIEMHRRVVRLFFGAARKMLAEEGEVHVSHKRGYPYCRWNIVELARENAGLMLAREAAFRTWDYPGYENKKGYGLDWNRTFPVEDASVFIFCCKT